MFIELWMLTSSPPNNVNKKNLYFIMFIDYYSICTIIGTYLRFNCLLAYSIHDLVFDQTSIFSAIDKKVVTNLQ